MSQSLPIDELKFDKNINLEDKLNTSDYNDIGYFVEVDLSNPDNIKGKQRILPLLRKIKKIILVFLLHV